MGCLVMKFGGASLSSPEDFSKVAELISKKYDLNKNLVIVMSAMANMTDHLIDLAQSIHPSPPQRELDMLVSIGERVSISLLCMALHSRGIKAISFTGSQSGILTTCDHSQARILDVRPYRLQKHLSQKEVVIVAGFQGVSLEKEITTLGRGGSDTSAVALAVSLEAVGVEFYKDVGSLYSRDPKQDANAVRIPKISLKKALEQAKEGSYILHPRCLHLAYLNAIPLSIHSLEVGAPPGTLIFSRKMRNPSKKNYECSTF